MLNVGNNWLHILLNHATCHDHMIMHAVFNILYAFVRVNQSYKRTTKAHAGPVTLILLMYTVALPGCIY